VVGVSLLCIFLLWRVKVVVTKKLTAKSQPVVKDGAVLSEAV